MPVILNTAVDFYLSIAVVIHMNVAVSLNVCSNIPVIFHTSITVDTYMNIPMNIDVKIYKNLAVNI